MMKIVLVVPSLKQSGVLEVVRNILIQGKKDSKIDFFLISLKDIQNYDNKNKMRDLLGKRLIVLTGHKLITLNKIVTFRNVIKRINPDIVHFHAFESDLFSIFISRRNYKIISTAHNMGKYDFMPTYGNILGYTMGLIQKFLYKRMDLIIGVSKTVTKYYQQLGMQKVQLVYNGTSISLDNYDNNIFANLPRPIGIYSGNFEPRKNVVFMLDGYSKFIQKGTLVVLGDNPRNPETLKEYRKKYSNKHIIFKGRVQNVAKYLKQADYIISPSLSEGLPMAVIEGMACNLPMILSNIPQHRELKLDDNEDIFFFDPKEESSLEKAIYKYYDKLPHKNCSNVKIFENNFSSNHMYNAYKNQYEKVLGRNMQ